MLFLSHPNNPVTWEFHSHMITLRKKIAQVIHVQCTSQLANIHTHSPTYIMNQLVFMYTTLHFIHTCIYPIKYRCVQKYWRLCVSDYWQDVYVQYVHLPKPPWDNSSGTGTWNIIQLPIKHNMQILYIPQLSFSSCLNRAAQNINCMGR